MRKKIQKNKTKWNECEKCWKNRLQIPKSIYPIYAIEIECCKWIECKVSSGKEICIMYISHEEMVWSEYHI